MGYTYLKKSILVGIALFFILISFPAMEIHAANRIAYVNFENSLSDQYGFVSVQEANGGGSADDIVTYVPGYRGMAARSSHNLDDGGNDLEAQPALFPASGALYIRFHLKYELDYLIPHSPPINHKWLWTLGDIAHNEIILENLYFDSYNRVAVYWSLSGGGAGFAGGTGNRISGNTAYSKGNWMKVEIYIKLSSGASHANRDGVCMVKIDDETVLFDSSVVTGMPGRLSSPAIKATGDNSSGHGWWQIDEYELWDDIPPSGTSFLIPNPPNGIQIN